MSKSYTETYGARINRCKERSLNCILKENKTKEECKIVFGECVGQPLKVYPNMYYYKKGRRKRRKIPKTSSCIIDHYKCIVTQNNALPGCIKKYKKCKNVQKMLRMAIFVVVFIVIMLVVIFGNNNDNREYGRRNRRRRSLINVDLGNLIN
jgi:hypothetical protein